MTLAGNNVPVSTSPSNWENLTCPDPYKEQEGRENKERENNKHHHASHKTKPVLSTFVVIHRKVGEGGVGRGREMLGGHMLRMAVGGTGREGYRWHERWGRQPIGWGRVWWQVASKGRGRTGGGGRRGKVGSAGVQRGVRVWGGVRKKEV